MENRNCENCAHARPFGGENDNRCDAWECEYIDRKEAIEAYKARRDIVRCGECEYWTGYCTNKIWQSPTDDYLPQTYADDFCSYGERKE